MQRHPGQRGLTLVESVVVLSVVSIGAAIAVPNLRSSFDLRRLEGHASQLATDLQLARNEAIARNRGVRLSWYASTSCYVIHTGAATQCSCTPEGSGRCEGGATLVRSVGWTAADRVSLASNTASIVFDPLHGTASPSATWRVTGADGRAIHHIINVMGRVRSCSPLGTVPGQRAC